ncbi:MAG: hypothetical protein Q8835_03625, partial [Sweet potato little leaf phytoplasma]|nr:hypothetical protein [Sweet potato little leaf phytoplasma]
SSGISSMSFELAFGIKTTFIPILSAAKTFSFNPPIAITYGNHPNSEYFAPAISLPQQSAEPDEFQIRNSNFKIDKSNLFNSN